MNSYILGVYEKAMPETFSLEQKLSCSKDSGFDFLEISIDETDKKLSRLDWDSEQRHSLVKAIWNTGVPIKTICLSGHRRFPLGSINPTIQKKALEIMEKAVMFACDIGVRIIQIAGYDEYYSPSNLITAANFESNLRKCVKIASKHGVVLAFETMETEFIDTVSKAQHYVQLINSPYLKIYPDIGNVSNAVKKYGTDIIDDFKTGIENIVAVHLKETVPGRYRDMMYGEGDVDFNYIIPWLKEKGICIFNAEFWCRNKKDPYEDLKSACKFLRSILDKC